MTELYRRGGKNASGGLALLTRVRLRFKSKTIVQDSLIVATVKKDFTESLVWNGTKKHRS